MNARFVPISETIDTVTLRRSDFADLLALAEDVADIGAIQAARARLAAGEDEAIPYEWAARILAGESPILVWREYRGLKAKDLALKADITPAYLSEIESGKKPGSLEVLKRIAGQLRVSLDDLAIIPN